MDLSMSVSVDPSSVQALVKILALLVTGFSVHVSLSPPNPPAPPKLRLAASRKTLFERCVRWVTFCSKVSSSCPKLRFPLPQERCRTPLRSVHHVWR